MKDYLKRNGFKQTRESDKRDNFEKDMYDPWVQSDVEVHAIIHHNIGCKDDGSCGPLLEITKNVNGDRIRIYFGEVPLNFDDKDCLMRLLNIRNDVLRKSRF